MKKLQFFVWIFLITALSGTLLSLGGSAGCSGKASGEPAGGFCGDGHLNENEECDDGNTVDDANCLQDCTLPEGKTAECGNGIPELGEQCDGTSLNNQTCLSLGFESGNLVCNPNCLLDTSDCKASNGGSCGDNVINAGEACDGTAVLGEDCTSQGFHSGTLTCQSDCQGYDTSSCISHGDFLTLQHISDIDGDNYTHFFKDDSGNVYLLGTFLGPSLTLKVNGQDQVLQNTGAVGTSADAFLAKINPNGESFDWVVSFSGPGNESIILRAFDTQGNIYISGGFSGATMTTQINGVDKIWTKLGAGTRDAFVAKLNPADGQLSWLSQIASKGSDWINSILVNSDNDLYISGYFRGSSLQYNGVDSLPNLNNTGNDDGFFAKINKTNGNLIWIKGVVSDSADSPHIYGNLSSKEVYLFGVHYGTSLTLPVKLQNQTLTNMGGVDAYWGSINTANGNLLWLQSAAGNGHDQIYSMQQDTFGNVYVSGGFSGDSLHLAMSDGSNQTLNNPTNNDPSGSFFGLIDKATGKFSWVTHLSSNQSDFQNLRPSPSGELYITGTFEGSSLKVNGVDQLTNTSNGTSDGFIGKIDATNGSVLWITPISSNHNDGVNVSISPTGDLYVTGDYSGDSLTLPVGDEDRVLINPNSGTGDSFLGKIDPSNGHFVWLTPISSDSSDSFFISIVNLSTLYVTGSFSGTSLSLPVNDQTVVLTNIDNSGTSYDRFFGKVDVAEGTFDWVTLISGEGDNIIVSVQDGSGNIYLTGTFSSSITLPLLGEEITFTNPSTGSYDSWFGKIAP